MSFGHTNFDQKTLNQTRKRICPIICWQEDQKETESRSSALKNFEDFVEKMRKTLPDPIVTIE